MKRLWCAVWTLLLAGCLNLESPAPAEQTRLVVHAILDAEADQQKVLLYRARTGLPTVIEGSRIGDDEPVTGANVSITTPEGATLNNWLCCGPGTYVFPDSLQGPSLTPGGTYTLRIRTPFGEEVTGTTTIPGPSHLTLDSPRVFLRFHDTLRLSWPPVRGAASYEVIIRMPLFNEEYRTFADTAFTLAGTALTITGDEIFPWGQEVTVLVSAVDVNYYDYYGSQSDPFAGAAPSHLTGAVGVFGSIVPIYATTLLVR